jgi:hypothetical protein
MHIQNASIPHLIVSANPAQNPLDRDSYTKKEDRPYIAITRIFGIILAQK